jgi:hypothetical protein
VSSGAHDTQHAERFGVAQVIAEIDYCVHPMLLDQSTDAFTLIGNHWWKQLTGKLSAVVAQAMRFGDTDHEIV